MSEPSYDRIVRSLREQAVPADDHGEATRRRIRETLSQRPAILRVRRLRLTLALAAALATSTALAFYVRSRVDSEQTTAPPRAADKLRAATPADTIAETPPTRLIGEDSPTAKTGSLAKAAVPPKPLRRSPTRAPTTPRPRFETTAQPAHEAASAPAHETERPSLPASPAQRDGLYLTAHRLHFRGTPAAALAAWDAFLSTEPTGGSAIEAHYNRAVVLLRLGRHEEARTELLPFAQGEHGPYRQAAAQRLLSTPRPPP